MIYNNEYQIKFYINSRTGENPVLQYLKRQDSRSLLKIYKYLNYLAERNGYLDESFSRHLFGKIRELRVDFANNHHRLLYFSFFQKNIIVLSAFSKKTRKTTHKELKIAEERYGDVINNPKIYE
ncbi:MAG: type II toxin-antitoxin system RelE/ParE family toxin [Patescibacteria group bacterium]